MKTVYKEGILNTPYPYESLEMIAAHISVVFDEQEGNYKQEELPDKLNVFVFNLERLLGAASGSFNLLKKGFGIEYE